MIYVNDLSHVFLNEKRQEKEMLTRVTDRSVVEPTPYVLIVFTQTTVLILNKTLEILMKEKVDEVVVFDTMVFGLPILCKIIKISCVAHSTSKILNPINFNLPNVFSLITTSNLTRPSSRLYNIAFTLNLGIQLLVQILLIAYSLLQTFLHVPCFFYDSFTERSFFVLARKILEFDQYVE